MPGVDRSGSKLVVVPSDRGRQRKQSDTLGRRLASDLRASLDAIDGGKHFTPEDHPERVAAGIDRVVAAAVP